MEWKGETGKGDSETKQEMGVGKGGGGACKEGTGLQMGGKREIEK